MGTNKQFSQYIEGIEKTSKQIKCFTILNTAKRISKYYFTPIRRHDNLYVCGVVVSNSLEAKKFATLADGKFDYIAVDCEKKIEPLNYSYRGDYGNIKGIVQDTVKQSKLITFKANDLTVEAIDIFIDDKLKDIDRKKVAIAGTGNIGFKLALKLVERGCWVNMYRRDQKKLGTQVDCINLTKPKGTLAKAYVCRTLKQCLKGVHVIVAAADTSNFITLEDLKRSFNQVILIDCGKACFDVTVLSKYDVFRTDVGMTLIYQLKMIIESQEHLHDKFGQKIMGKKRYVCGISGKKGDIILKDINDIDSIIGVCDGKGGLKTWVNANK